MAFSTRRTLQAGCKEYARSPYQTPHLAGASAPGWSTFTGGSEHVGPHVLFYCTTPRLIFRGGGRGVDETHVCRPKFF